VPESCVKKWFFNSLLSWLWTTNTILFSFWLARINICTWSQHQTNQRLPFVKTSYDPLEFDGKWPIQFTSISAQWHAFHRTKFS
jgi:hypothetical protein